MTVPPTSDAISYENIDSVVPSDAMGMQVVESFFIGDETYLKANFLLVGLDPKSGSETWLKNLLWSNGLSWEIVQPSSYSFKIGFLETLKHCFSNTIFYYIFILKTFFKDFFLFKSDSQTRREPSSGNNVVT